jgi:hypothetical protein
MVAYKKVIHYLDRRLLIKNLTEFITTYGIRKEYCYVDKKSYYNG